jgi:arginase family enzyme
VDQRLLSNRHPARPKWIEHCRRAYAGYSWHPDLQLVDIGNIKSGSSIKDSYAALRAVVSELVEMGKTVIILGGSHDLTIAQYEVYRHAKTFTEAVCIDALIDLGVESTPSAEHFLMHILTDEPNYIKHYNHI